MIRAYFKAVPKAPASASAYTEEIRYQNLSYPKILNQISRQRRSRKRQAGIIIIIIDGRTRTFGLLFTMTAGIFT